jgi:hydroxymethylpyrimidine pyrophosphatase-like HAD family hydrolase
MQNIIFLDIDGVLNNIEVKFKDECVNVVKELIKQHDAKIVIISSWQWNGTQRIRNNIKIIFEKLGIYNIDFIDPNYRGNICFKGSLSPIEIDSRLLGIIDYLKKNKDSNYVILDDDYHNDYKFICLNHYKTIALRGLTYEDISKIKFKPVNLNNFEYINYKYRELGLYELKTNQLIKVLKKKYQNDIK